MNPCQAERPYLKDRTLGTPRAFEAARKELYLTEKSQDVRDLNHIVKCDSALYSRTELKYDKVDLGHKGAENDE